MRPLNISELGFEGLIAREWLAVNGLGGYACSTLCGLNTRKYHGLLVAAMAPPARRLVLLSHVDEVVICNEGAVALGCNEYPGAVSPRGFELMRAFSSDPFPRWAYQAKSFTLEKSLRMLPGENTICLTYSLLAGGGTVRLEARPLMAMRGIHELMYQWNGRLVAENRPEGQVRVPATAKTPEVFFAHDGQFQPESYWYFNFIYRREEERGYSGLEDLWNPGVFNWTMSPGQTVHLICSVDPVEVGRVTADLGRMAREIDRRQTMIAGENGDETLESLIRAASAFVVHGTGEPSSRTVAAICQYPWAGPSGRAALIAFAGLFLVPGRFEQGARLLQSLAAQLHEGLIPTEFSEDGYQARYSGADTSLWFINAVGEYLTYTGDVKSMRALLPAVETIIAAYRAGTKLGIEVDGDGLMSARSPGEATSWMDAQLNDWVVTPRQGRQVELNALWYNALRIGADLETGFGKSTLANEWTALARNVRATFNRRFWNETAHCCFDVVNDDGADGSIRPNQILAVGLAHPVLATEHHAALLGTVQNELLTPMGLRTLSPGDPAYQGRYGGGVVSRDRAHHQGSVHPWLLSFLGSAYLRLHGRETTTIMQVKRWLEGCLNYLRSDGLGQICELFDGNDPHHPGGAVASALSVGEVLHCYARDVLGLRPAARPMPGPIRIPPSGVQPAETRPQA